MIWFVCVVCVVGGGVWCGFVEVVVGVEVFDFCVEVVFDCGV